MKNSQGRSEPPDDLSRSAKDWFRRLVAEYAIEDDAGLLLLVTAMRAFDRAEGARSLLDRDGITLTDRFGQQKPHPAAAVERDSRQGLLAALRALNLDIEPLHDGPGRPPGR